MSGTIDRDVPVPLYYQIYKLLENEITGGVYSPGDYFSTEMELQSKFDVSRATIRNALEMLESNGLIFRVTGKGIFISPVKMKIDLPDLLSFSDEMRRRGMAPTSRLLEVRVVDAPVTVAKELGLAGKALLIPRVRCGDGLPIVYSESFLDEALGLTAADDFTGSLYELVQRKTGRLVDEAYHAIEGGLVEEGIAEHLDVAPGFPALRYRRTAYDQHGAPLIYETGVIRADQYAYEIRLKRKP